MNATICSIDGVAATRTVRGPKDHPRVRSNDIVGESSASSKFGEFARGLDRAALHLITAVALSAVIGEHDMRREVVETNPRGLSEARTAIKEARRVLQRNTQGRRLSTMLSAFSCIFLIGKLNRGW